MLLLSLFALTLFNSVSADCDGSHWTAPAGLWGDPHITTWNQVYMHFQGDVNLPGPDPELTGRPNQILYYLMTNCNPDDTENPPYRMLGSFVQYVNGPMSVMNYVVLELFDTDETYYVFLTPGRYIANNDRVIPVRKYFRKSDGAGPDLRANNRAGIAIAGRLGAGDNCIGSRFTINLNGDLDLNFNTLLTIRNIDGTAPCTLNFNIRLGDTPHYLYRWTYITVYPPNCDRCEICGLFGDFQTPLGESRMLQCDGTYKYYTTNWAPSAIEFEGAGWTFELNQYEQCGVEDEPTCEDAYLSDITPDSAQAGWGTVNDGVNEWIGYTSMAMGNGVTYQKFLVVHPNVDMASAAAFRTYPLDGQYSRLTAVVGSAQTTNTCRDQHAAYGSFSVEILVDGVQAYYRDGYGRDGYDTIDIDVTGAEQVTIKTLPGADGWGCDHPAIANPVLSCVEPVFECPEETLSAIQAAAQEQRDGLNICCRNLGGAFCTRLLDGAIDDICIVLETDVEACLDDLIKDYFTSIVEGECENQGKFGPVPRLLYDFQSGSLEGSEVISSGNPTYDLQSVGNAQIVNGLLRCDGSDDYVYSANNFDFDVDGDHSLEVLVAIDNINSVGGGAIAIDNNYNQANGGYAHDQFDSIVYNEIGGNKWLLGSDYFRRTKDTSGTARSGITAETQNGIFLQMIAVYDATNNVAKLYRNGVKELEYTPQGGFLSSPADPDGAAGTRIMFCQRHLHAGASDFPGKIALGAYYDYALSEEDVAILYDTGIINIDRFPYENVGDELRPDKRLTAGQALVSVNRQYAAAMQEDGNFVVYQLDGSGNIILSQLINTGGQVADTSFLVLQSSDCNVVVYDGQGGHTFEAGKSDVNCSPIFLIMQNDGNLVAYTTDDKGLIAYYDSKGYTTNGPIRAGKSDYFDFDSFIGNNTTESTTSYMSYLLYLVGFLLITNIVCLTVYCLRKKENKRTRYKVVSIDSSDAEEVNLK